MKKLVIFSADWADEFKCEQFKVMTEEDYLEWQDEWDSRDAGEDACFGTNEWFTVGDIIQDFKVIDIADVEAATISKYLGNTFGTGVL